MSNKRQKVECTYQYVISKEGIPIFSSPSLLDAPPTSSTVLGQPFEIILLIGNFLNQKDLARAQRVNRSWYWTFGRDSLWLRYLPPLHSTLEHSLKVEVVYQALLKECWVQGCVDMKKDDEMDVYKGVWDGVISPDGSWMLNVGGHGFLFLWRGIDSDHPTGLQIAGSTLKDPSKDPHGGRILRVIISADGRSAFTVGDKGRMAKWIGFEKGDEIVGSLIAGEGTSLDPHESKTINGIGRNKDGTVVLTVGDLGRVVQWSGLESDSPKAVVLCGKGMERNPHELDCIQNCCVSPDGDWAFTVGKEIIMWRGLLTGKVNATVLYYSVHAGNPVLDCAISQDGKMVLTVGKRGRVSKWTQLDDEWPTSHLVNETLVNLKRVTLSPDGTWAFVCGDRKVFIFYDLNKEMPSVQKETFHVPYVHNILISPSSRWALVLSRVPFRVFPKLTLEKKKVTPE